MPHLAVPAIEHRIYNPISKHGENNAEKGFAIHIKKAVISMI